MAKAFPTLTGSQKLIGFFKKELASLKASGHEDERQNMAELGLRLAEQQRLTQAPTLISDMLALSWRPAFLKHMDPGTEIVNTGRTAAEELQVWEQENLAMRQFTKEINSAHDYLMNAPLEVQGQYADRMMMDGEMAAIKYVLEEKAKQKR